MKALTVQQPWAWAIVHGGKDIENRTQAWSYRGLLAVHAGNRISERGTTSRLVNEALHRVAPADQHGERSPWLRGFIIGVVDLVDVHVATPEHIGPDGRRVDFCCDSHWAESSYAEHGGRTRRDIVHMVLENPRPLAEPIPCRGALGLWTVPAGVDDQVALQLPLDVTGAIEA